VRDDKYWADDESARVVSGAIERIRRFRETLRVTGRADRARRSWNCYLGWGANMDQDASRINAGGEQGEITRITANHYAALVNQAVVLTTSNKPATKAVPRNMDSESLGAAQFAEALNDYYERELSVAEREWDATLTMVLMSEAWLVLDWDATAGGVYLTDENGQPRYEGDVKLYALTLFDVAVDPDAQDVEAHNWILWRRRVNRWDLAAKHPALRDEIIGQGGGRDATSDVYDSKDDFLFSWRKRSNHADTDTVVVWELRHKPTPALPMGRMVRFISERCVLFDSRPDAVSQTPSPVSGIETPGAQAPAPDVSQGIDYGYAYRRNLFAYPCSPERIPGTPDGHTSFFDLLSLQSGADLGATIMASAINAGGLQNLYVPRGANITADKLTGALNVIEYDGTVRPEAQDNVSINPAVNAWAEMCVSWMRQRVSMNDVVVGEPQKGMPAQAMALLRAQAVEFHSRLQASYERLVQRTRTGILQLLQQFATVERKVLIAGKSRSWAVKNFTNKTLEPVDRFVCEPVPAMMKTLAGRVGFAQPLLDQGKMSLREYLALVETGRWEPTFGYDDANTARIQQEIELLTRGIGLAPPVPGPDGRPVPSEDGQEHLRPLITDTHWQDIKQYLAVLGSPGSRENPAVVAATLEAITYKMQLWRSMDPALIMLQGGMPAPPLGPPGAPVAPPAPPSGGHSATPAEGPGGKMPQPPPNPITKQQDQHTAIQAAPPPGIQ